MVNFVIILTIRYIGGKFIRNYIKIGVIIKSKLTKEMFANKTNQHA